MVLIGEIDFEIHIGLYIFFSCIFTMDESRKKSGGHAIYGMAIVVIKLVQLNILLELQLRKYFIRDSV